ncbi:MAG TPA: hypothetical protein VFF76_09175 [Holophagaceae bacterium]|jgi:hypothetical protein|nr:hypothetical protein [Holophagaceae bacterium]
MRRTALLPLLTLALAAPAVQAQDFHPGFTIDLIAPTGSFNSKTYPPTAGVLTPQTEAYDVGIGATFNMSFPTSRVTAIRLNLGFAANNGTNTAQGYSTLNLRHSQFNLGGDLQIFPGEGAYRHRGFYLLGGLSADFEKFERSFGNFSYWDNYYYGVDTTNKSRMGGEAGFGNTFGGDAGPRFTLEVVYHTSLTGHDAAAGDPPATSYVRAGFGLVF